MEAAPSHLHPSALAILDESPAIRIRRIRTDRWIGYARAQTALNAIEDLLTFPKRMRMPNLLLVGPTNNGKTMIVERFRRGHFATEADETPDGTAVVPVLKVQMPPGADERRFFGAILQALGIPGTASYTTVASRQDAAVRLMRSTNTKLLIVDEAQNLLSGTRDQQRRVLNVLRWLGNELQISLVAVGTPEALRAIQSDEQLANRFEPVALPTWHAGDEYQRLLATLESVLPLRQPSHLSEPELANRILAMTEGVLGEIVTVVTRAAALAVSSGAESINVGILDQIGFISPSGRRRVAV
ncbi:MAG: TniB family NTP-binding protein [Proteobacteria bacterium]|nr:TniB family NTP-binding protein [Pseudomonadota bacterium]